MQYIVETHDGTLEDSPSREESRFYGLFSFKESAEHAGEMVTKAGGSEAGRAFDVRELIHPGPSTLAEWLQLVRVQIEHYYSARYDVDLDTFGENPAHGSAEDESANAAYYGAKLAMQLLQVQ